MSQFGRREFIALCGGAAAHAGQTKSALPNVTLAAAGATFPYPIYAKWFDAFHNRAPRIAVNYEPVGSGEGLKRLSAGSLDFAASDWALNDAKYRNFATVLGAAVPIYNLDGLREPLRFTQDALAGIYLGRVKQWNDPLLQAANRGLKLPAREIKLTHRADSSGTSYLWTEYLAKVSPEWKTKVGVNALPVWPTGQGANGNAGVAELVRKTPDSFGYVEYIYALRNQLSFGSVRNRAGNFVTPDLESIAAAAGADSERSVSDPKAPAAYPIVSFSWLVVPRKIRDNAKRIALKELLIWILYSGQKQAAALGYVALPEAIRARQLAEINSL